MDFWNQVLATFIGAFVALLFSMALFYLTERWKTEMGNKDLLSNLQSELDFNLEFLRNYKDEFDKTLRKISAGDKNIYTIFKFIKLQRLFLMGAFNKGLLYKLLNSEEITDLDSMLTYFNTSTEQIAWSTLNGFKSGEIQKQAALEYFEYDREQIGKYIKVIESVKKKLKKPS